MSTRYCLHSSFRIFEKASRHACPPTLYTYNIHMHRYTETIHRSEGKGTPKGPVYLTMIPLIGVTLSEWLSHIPSPPEGWSRQHAPHLSTGNIVILIIIAIIFGPLLINISAWVLWLLISIVLGISRTCYSIFVMFHVAADVWALSAMKTVYTIYRWIRWYVHSVAVCIL